MSTLDIDSQNKSRALLAQFRPGHCEFVHDFAYKLPIEVFMMMGFDPDRRDECIGWIEAIFRGKALQETVDGFTEADRFVTKWLTTQLAAPEKNEGRMFRAMIESTYEGRPLTFAEMHSITMMLFMGGLDIRADQFGAGQQLL